jgi:hypothetical protein
MHKILTPLICLLTACANPAFAQTPPEWRDYFPLKVGLKWTYLVNDDAKKKDAKKKVVIEVEREEAYARKETKNGNIVEEKYKGFILEISSGDKVQHDHVAVMESGVYRIHTAGTLINPPLLFFKFHIKSGESWTIDSISSNASIKGTCTLGVEQVAVPYKGKHNAIFVSFSNDKPGDEKQEIKYWFAKDIGMVKQHVKTKNHEITLTLENFEQKKVQSAK